MATKLNHGLVGFTRQRIGLRQSRGSTSAGRLTHCSIHHGGPVGPPRMTFESAARTWREWQAYHQAKGWNDIGYNIGIDGLGRLYQGRPVGQLPAAVGGHNSGSFGINFMQDGRSYGLNAAQRQTLAVLFEHGCPKWSIPPLRTLAVRCHNEYPGHESNECPGGHIKRHVRWRRSRPNR
jgi:hypothetical protein